MLGRITLLCCAVASASLSARTRAQSAQFVGLIPKAPSPIVMDGSLNGWESAFIAPLNSADPDFANRATLVYFLWDDQALYIGLRALDRHPIDLADDKALYDGDAVEFYLDTRSGSDLGAPTFGPGTLHMFFTALTGGDLRPRYHIRDLPAFAGLTLKGVDMAAARSAGGYTLEFKLPWANFPGFHAQSGTPIGIDVEMGSSDGGHRVHRTFVYSSPASVDSPATFGRVLLVDQLRSDDLVRCSRALFPFDAQVPGNYGWVIGRACLSPTIAGRVSAIEGDLRDAAGNIRKTVQNASLTTAGEYWRIWRGEWETYDLPPGRYSLDLIAKDAQGNVVSRRNLAVIVGVVTQERQAVSR